MNAESLFKTGSLDECRKQLFLEVKQSPLDVKLRVFLFQFCCITEEWQKALSQLELLNQLDPGTLPLVSTYRQLIKCEQLRSEVFSGNVTPTCFGPPSEWLAYHFQILSLLKQSKHTDVASLLSTATEMAPDLSGKINDEAAFSWLSDADSRFGSCMEVILQGGYYWLPLENVERLDFEPVEDLRDLIWRAVNIRLRNKGILLGFVPVRYPINPNTSDMEKLSRHTTWSELDKGFYIGQGQRVWITDDAEYLFSEINSVEFGN